MADAEEVILHHPDLPDDQVISSPDFLVEYYGASGWKPVAKSRQKAAAAALTTPDKEQ